jgi:Transposase IS116/IS110/IS902 family
MAPKDDDVILLMTIPGIGYYSALLIKSEIGNIERFPDGEHLCPYAGLVPIPPFIRKARQVRPDHEAGVAVVEVDHGGGGSLTCEARHVHLQILSLSGTEEGETDRGGGDREEASPMQLLGP